MALGPLTNVAMAMRLDRQFASNLKELYIMGGNTEGDYHIFQSFMIYNNPKVLADDTENEC